MDLGFFRASTSAIFRVVYRSTLVRFRSLENYFVIEIFPVLWVNFRQPRMQKFVSFPGENAVLFLPAPSSGLSLFSSSFEDFRLRSSLE